MHPISIKQITTTLVSQLEASDVSTEGVVSALFDLMRSYAPEYVNQNGGLGEGSYDARGFIYSMGIEHHRFDDATMRMSDVGALRYDDVGFAYIGD